MIGNSIAGFLGVGGGAAGGSSFESIATATGTGSSATITFSSIPGTYSALQIRAIGKSAATAFAAVNMFMRFNSDTTSGNYRNHYLRGTGTAAQAGTFSSTADGFVIGLIPDSTTSAPNLTSIVGANIIDVLDYASTSKNKTVRAISGVDANTANTNFQITLQSGLWVSTAAVTSITLLSETGNFTTALTFALYGIKG